MLCLDAWAIRASGHSCPNLHSQKQRTHQPHSRADCGSNIPRGEHNPQARNAHFFNDSLDLRGCRTDEHDDFRHLLCQPEAH